MNRLRHALPVALLLAAPASAQTPAAGAPPVATEADTSFIDADRPGYADTSTVVGKGRVQIEAGVQHESRRNLEASQRTVFVPLLVRVGVSTRVELRVEGNSFTHVSERSGGTSATASGLAPFSIGFKGELQKSDGVGRPGVGVIGRLFPSWGVGDFRAHRAAGDLRLAMVWDVASKISLNPNVGIGWFDGGEGRFVAGQAALTLGYSPITRANVFVDIGLQAPETAGGHTGAVVDAGVAWLVARNAQLDVSVGTRAIGETGPRPFVAAGLSLRTRARRRSG